MFLVSHETACEHHCTSHLAIVVFVCLGRLLAWDHARIARGQMSHACQHLTMAVFDVAETSSVLGILHFDKSHLSFLITVKQGNVLRWM
jgi:hypothetical protein